jgi:hypothetical protein
MNKREDYEKILSDLKSSQSEKEVIENITKIVKSFTSDFYKNDLYQNSYFKSILLDTKELVSKDLCIIKENLNDEIKAIEDEIIKLNKFGISSIKDSDISKLRNLKKECILLIKELDIRLEDLRFI